MKRAAAVILILCTLTGCKAGESTLKPALDLRKSLLEAESCSFQAVVTADYSDVLYTFQLECVADSTGTMNFTVTDPASISGITGTISDSEAALTFDDKILAFPFLADGDLSPVCAPWVFVNSLRGGYISGCSSNSDGLCIYIDDSFEEDPLRLEVYTNTDNSPISVQISWQDRYILSMDIRNFSLQ